MVGGIALVASDTSSNIQLKAVKDNDLEENIFKTVADHAPIMLWMTNDKGAPIFFNRSWLHFTGLEPEQALGDAWINTLHPDDRATSLEQYGIALQSYRPIRLEYRLLRYDGVYRHMLDMGDPRHDENGNFAGFVGCTVDITDQKETQIELKHSHSTLAQRSREITLLNELNDNLQVCQTVTETRKILDRYGRALFPGQSGTICLYKSSRNVVEPFTGWGDDQHLTKAFKPDDCWALRKGKVHCEMDGKNGYICPNVSESCNNVSYACVPMMAYGEVIGVMHMGLSDQVSEHVDKDWLDPSSAKRRLTAMTADQVALALANLQLRETLHFQSTRDPLTSLYNRRYFYECLERELVRAETAECTLSLLMLDIDGFKNYNDTHGHDAGDHVLRILAAQMKKTVRKDDVICRYGGEEFSILMTDATEEVTIKRAENLRRQVEAMQIDYRDAELPPVTLSIGIAVYPKSGDTAPGLIEAADRALYKAKNSGRNRIVVSESENN